MATSRVRATAKRVVALAEHVTIRDEKVKKMATKLSSTLNDLKTVSWDSGEFHYSADAAKDGPLTCQYVFVLDTLNFCFWPTLGMEYVNLAQGLKTALEKDANAFSAENLCKLDRKTLCSWFHPFTPPQVDERIRKVQELGHVLRAYFDGLAFNMVKHAHGSAEELVRLILASMTGFQDHSVYKGEQVYFYKRAQILVGDIWAAYGRRTEGIFGFQDIGALTMFADYRVPQVLAAEGIIVYSNELAQMILEKKNVPFGSEMEIEIRAATVEVVERIHEVMVGQGSKLHVIELDWLLWQIGESQLNSLPPHHRTLTVFY